MASTGLELMNLDSVTFQGIEGDPSLFGICFVVEEDAPPDQTAARMPVIESRELV